MHASDNISLLAHTAACSGAVSDRARVRGVVRAETSSRLQTRPLQKGLSSVLRKRRAPLAVAAFLVLAASAITWSASDPLAGLPAAQREVLSSLGVQYRSNRTQHYFVVTSGGAELLKDVARTMELLHRNLKYLFGYEGELRNSLVLVFSDADQFEQYRKKTAPTLQGNVRGFYSSGSKSIVTYDDGNRAELTRVLMHEGSHQFLFLVAPKAPLWFHEGVAVYLECSRWDGARLEVGQVPRDRLQVIRQAIREDKYRPLDELIAMEFGQEFTSTDYAAAWSLVFFFAKAENGRYAPRIQKYFKMLKANSDAERAFHECFAKDFGPEGYAALDRHWSKFVLEDLK